MKILFPEKINEFEKQHTDSSNALAVAIRFIGTHSEYDRIKDIKNI